ncbi:MAG TPA: LytTR family DNA-binding domain-containing protein, partial [Thermoanaerobaculia bacterium]|nr:LytTR family DNA-binding domain-containing protein [Thermoanaerobaculia bacterium]
QPMKEPNPSLAPKITAVIVDDEPLGRKLVRQLMRDVPDFRLVGEAGSVDHATALLASTRPDVVFLDVALPDGDAFDVLERLGPSYSSVTIFVTAHDTHAVQAFDVDAADYLLKPIRRERFQKAVARARRIHESRSSAHGPGERTIPVSVSTPRPRRLAVTDADDRLHLIAVEEIDSIEAARNYVQVHTGAAAHVFREGLTALERRLDPQQFVRVHRSFIVNIDRIVHLEPNGYGDYVITLRDGTRIPLSRRYRDRLSLLIGHL